MSPEKKHGANMHITDYDSRHPPKVVSNDTECALNNRFRSRFSKKRRTCPVEGCTYQSSGVCLRMSEQTLKARNELNKLDVDSVEDFDPGTE